MIILAIETSCDETAAAVIKDGVVLSNVVASQIDIHKKTGGIVPEVASRAHVEKILPVIEEALQKASKNLELSPESLEKSQNSALRPQISDLMSQIDLIAVTVGPGLVGSLLVGVEAAKTLSYLLNKPIIGINHLEGHIYANFIGEKTVTHSDSLRVINGDSLPANKLRTKGVNHHKSQLNDDLISFPAICLTVSGGHTSLVLMKDIHSIKVIGETRDDAAGEAFDKVAKILNLGYPGGPAIETASQRHSRPGGNLLIDSPIKSGNDNNIRFPRPMLNEDDFSFSGLKTAVLYEVMNHPSVPPLLKGGG